MVRGVREGFGVQPRGHPAQGQGWEGPVARGSQLWLRVLVPLRRMSVMGAGNRTCAGMSKRYQLCRVQVRPAPSPPWAGFRVCAVAPGPSGQPFHQVQGKHSERPCARIPLPASNPASPACHIPWPQAGMSLECGLQVSVLWPRPPLLTSPAPGAGWEADNCQASLSPKGPTAAQLHVPLCSPLPSGTR